VSRVADPIAAYDGKAEDFAQHRLSYARGAIDVILETTGLDTTWIVADIGAGTGHVAKHFVGRVERLYAVEPNDDMRRQAERSLGGFAAFVSVSGTAEKTTLPKDSLALITVGQALHWFDAEAARREFTRVLKPDGWLAVIRNRLGEDQGPNLRPYFSDDVQHRSFPMTAKETWDTFIRGIRSSAASPAQSHPRYPSFERAQRENFDARAVRGILTLRYSTEVAVGRLRRTSDA